MHSVALETMYAARSCGHTRAVELLICFAELCSSSMARRNVKQVEPSPGFPASWAAWAVLGVPDTSSCVQAPALMVQLRPLSIRGEDATSLVIMSWIPYV